MDYNNKLIGIIDKSHSNADTKAAAPTNNYCRPTLSVTVPTPTAIPNLIDFDDCQQHKHTKFPDASSYDEISIQNVCGSQFCFHSNLCECEFESYFWYEIFFLACLFSKNLLPKMGLWSKKSATWSDKKRDSRRYVKRVKEKFSN